MTAETNGSHAFGEQFGNDRRRRKFWVGGATGFLGRHLVEHLVALGHEVVACSQRGGQVAGVKARALNMLDGRAVEESARGCDGAFYAVGRVSRDPAQAAMLYEVNVRATELALPALARAGIPRVVYVSTSGTIAVGTDPHVLHAETSPAPHHIISHWPYYRSKLYAEQLALECSAPRFEVVVVNPSLLLGPGDHGGSSNEDVRKLLAGTLPAVTGGGIAFVDVRDAAHALWLAFERGKPGSRYLISAANLSCEVFFGRLSRIANCKPPSFVLPRNRRALMTGFSVFEGAMRALGGSAPVDAPTLEMGSHFWYCDTSLAERELGFKARDSMETLRDTVVDLLETSSVVT